MSSEVKLWGSTTEVLTDRKISVQHATIKSRHACSWHSHAVRSNRFYVVSGKLGIQLADGSNPVQVVMPRQVFSVDPGVVHRMIGLAPETEVLEIYHGQAGPEDIQRLSSGGLMDDAQWAAIMSLVE